MRFNSLHFGKAISAALFVLLLVVVGSKNALAQTQVATLQHEGNIIVFYGPDALGNAHAAAAIGDTITLSSGNFNGCTFSIPVTVHGAGCVEDAIAGIAPTCITSTVGLNVRNDAVTLSFEGIQFSTNITNSYYGGSGNYTRNVGFSKCHIQKIEHNVGWSPTPINDLQLVNCIVKEFKYLGYGATIVNSVLGVTEYNQNDQNRINTIYNSVIVLGGNSLTNSMVNNCIISHGDNNNIGNSIFYNCIGIKLGETSLFESQLNSTNMELNGYENVFETFDGTVTYDNNYQLKEEIATTFLGNDGTEVGIYGGMLPYNTRPSYMIMRRCNVAGRTTVDDKLSVEIELNIDE